MVMAKGTAKVMATARVTMVMGTGMAAAMAMVTAMVTGTGMVMATGTGMVMATGTLSLVPCVLKFESGEVISY